MFATEMSLVPASRHLSIAIVSGLSFHELRRRSQGLCNGRLFQVYLVDCHWLNV